MKNKPLLYITIAIIIVAALIIGYSFVQAEILKNLCKERTTTSCHGENCPTDQKYCESDNKCKIEYRSSCPTCLDRTPTCVPNPNYNSSNNKKTDYNVCASYNLNESPQITEPEEIPTGTWGEMKSPDGDPLVKIILDTDEQDIEGDSWRFAYYSPVKNIFWVADMPGEFAPTWYGPFTGKPCGLN